MLYGYNPPVSVWITVQFIYVHVFSFQMYVLYLWLMQGEACSRAGRLIILCLKSNYVNSALVAWWLLVPSGKKHTHTHATDTHYFECLFWMFIPIFLLSVLCASCQETIKTLNRNRASAWRKAMEIIRRHHCSVFMCVCVCIRNNSLYKY